MTWGPLLIQELQQHEPSDPADGAAAQEVPNSQWIVGAQFPNNFPFYREYNEIYRDN